MTSTDTTATPTDSERKQARRIWNDVLCNSEVPGWKRDDLLAQALADQRAKYEAVAAELDQDADDDIETATEAYEAGTQHGWSDAADRIRKVAQQ